MLVLFAAPLTAQPTTETLRTGPALPPTFWRAVTHMAALRGLLGSRGCLDFNVISRVIVVCTFLWMVQGADAAGGGGGGNNDAAATATAATAAIGAAIGAAAAAAGAPVGPSSSKRKRTSPSKINPNELRKVLNHNIEKLNTNQSPDNQEAMLASLIHYSSCPTSKDETILIVKPLETGENVIPAEVLMIARQSNTFEESVSLIDQSRTLLKHFIKLQQVNRGASFYAKVLPNTSGGDHVEGYHYRVPKEIRHVLRSREWHMVLATVPDRLARAGDNGDDPSQRSDSTYYYFLSCIDHRWVGQFRFISLKPNEVVILDRSVNQVDADLLKQCFHDAYIFLLQCSNKGKEGAKARRIKEEVVKGLTRMSMNNQVPQPEAPRAPVSISPNLFLEGKQLPTGVTARLWNDAGIVVVKLMYNNASLNFDKPQLLSDVLGKDFTRSLTEYLRRNPNKKFSGVLTFGTGDDEEVTRLLWSSLRYSLTKSAKTGEEIATNMTAAMEIEDPAADAPNDAMQE